MIHIRKSDIEATQWSGGTTTELLIHPPTATYQKRDFDLRISTATVEVEESVFTDLPSYKRILLVLEGRLTLFHQTEQGDKKVILQQGEFTFFSGAWKTIAHGKVTDFNVIYRPEYDVSFTILSFRDKQPIHLDQTAVENVIWVLEGQVKINETNLMKNELGVISFNDQEIVLLEPKTQAVFISFHRMINDEKTKQ